MLNAAKMTVREIALEFPNTTRVFEEFKIDYCCGGARPFLEACDNVGANPELVIERIDSMVKTEVDDLDWLKDATLSSLIDYIEQKHHVLTRAEIAGLPPLMTKVASRHGDKHPELQQLEAVVNELCDDLSIHLTKEEEVLFPYVEKLERAHHASGAVPFSCFGTVQNPVRMMMMEHDSAGDLLRRMREIAADYKLPEGACMSYTALYARLQAFEHDLHQHIHLENNLLFPRAIELEKEYYGV